MFDCRAAPQQGRQPESLDEARLNRWGARANRMKKRAPRSRPKYDPSSRPSGAVRPDPPRPVVLVVDIDPTHRRIVRILLEVAVGARVLEAESSDQALSLARVFNPDLLISNLVNPSRPRTGWSL